MNTDIKNLTPEQKKALAKDLLSDPNERAAIMKEALAEEKAAEEAIKQEREEYKDLVEDSIKEVIPMCRKMSSELGLLKEHIYNIFSTVIAIKQDVFNTKEDQDSHTFTSADKMFRIKLGYNMNDDYDDTVNAGIAKVKAYLGTLAKDKNSESLVEAVLVLLSTGKEGTLKASKVMQLQQMADKQGDAEFIDAVQIIKDAYKPIRSKQYIRVWFKDEKNDWIPIPLDITAV